jgi:tetratricopeptide repeat protein
LGRVNQNLELTVSRNDKSEPPSNSKGRDLASSSTAVSESKQSDGSRSVRDAWLSQKAEYLADARAAYDLARRANRSGEHLLAAEIAEQTLKATSAQPQRIPLLQQKALALARFGSTHEALQTLEQVRASGGEDADTLGLMGRVYKDLATAAEDAGDRRKFLSESLRLYQEGFKRFHSPYCGINAAAQAVLLDDREAKRLAQETLSLAKEADDYYALATQAEAALILARAEEASDLYRRASEIAEKGTRWADLASTRKQCRALSLKLYGNRDKFNSCFPSGAVAAFAGHMVDAPDRFAPRFPSSAADSVRERIKTWLKEKAIRFSFSSAACGSDLIFLSEAQKAGVETHVVLPFAASSFLETSVRGGGEQWVSAFEQALKEAASVTILNDEVADEKSSVYDFTNRMVAAKARRLASTLYLEPKALAVWDGQPGDGRGGTADAVMCWCKAKIVDRHRIHPVRPEQDGPVPEEAMAPVRIAFDRTQTALPTGYKTAVCSIIHLYFADYFSLREKQHYLFQQTILNALAKTLATTNYPPVSRYGLGPDYVFVFDTMQPAGIFANQLLRSVAEAMPKTTDWTMELPRICLHTGPVQIMMNPVLNQYSHEGATLTRAGRIVRCLPPGVIYCTENFAALSALEAIREFQFEYPSTTKYDVGQDRLFRIRFK